MYICMKITGVCIKHMMQSRLLSIIILCLGDAQVAVTRE